jgi:hypothetical protein
MVDGRHIFIQNRAMKPPAIALNGAERRSRGRNGGGHLTNVQYKPIWSCHNESPLYKEYILILKNTECYETQ